MSIELHLPQRVVSLEGDGAPPAARAHVAPCAVASRRSPFRWELELAGDELEVPATTHKATTARRRELALSIVSCRPIGQVPCPGISVAARPDLVLPYVLPVSAVSARFSFPWP